MFQPWISQLKDFIKQLEGVELKQHHSKCAEYYSVEFTYEVSDDESLEVDLLVSPYWDTPKDFYDFLKTVRKKYRKK